MSRPLAEARGLAWRLGEFRLGPIDLQIRDGECLVVVGPNGAGKTTLLRLLAGLVTAPAGALRWRGRPYGELSRRQLARRIAYVPQIRPARIPLTVEQLTLQGRFPHLPWLKAAPGRRDFEAVDEALETVGIAGLRKRPLDELSGGERQAAFIAAALAQEARLLVLDEPTTHLDPSHQRDTAALIRRLNRDRDRTVVAATHDLNFASLVASRILALKEGVALTCDTPAGLLRTDVLQDLFEAPFEVVRGGPRPVTVLELTP